MKSAARFRISLALFLALTCAVLVLGACGDDDTSTATPVASATPTAPDNGRTDPGSSVPPPEGKWAYRTAVQEPANASCCWDTDTMKARIVSGLVRRSTLVWSGSGDPGWFEAGSVEAFQGQPFVD